MFDIKYQKMIADSNEKFLSQAIGRAKDEKIMKLSDIDSSKTKVDFNLLSDEAISYFCEKSKTNKNYFEQFLTNLGLIEEGKFNNQAIILFAKEPRQFFPQAGIKVKLLFAGNNSFKDYDGPMVLAADKIEKWYNTLPKILVTNGSVREEKPIYPFKVIREAIINAIVHRDYDIEGAKIQIVIDDTQIMVQSPGQPVDGIKFEQIRNFSAPSLSRNPKISYIFNKMKLMEETGFGMRTFSSVPQNYNLPLPIYTKDETYITLSLFLSNETKQRVITAKSSVSLSEDERKGFNYIKSIGKITKSDYAKHFGLSEITAKRQLQKLKELGLIRMEGQSVNTYYIAV